MQLADAPTTQLLLPWPHGEYTLGRVMASTFAIGHNQITGQLQQYVTGQPPYLTYRGKSRPDRIYISPELAAVFVTTSFQQQFADHGALWATFQLPDSPATKWVMVCPQPVPDGDSTYIANNKHYMPLGQNLAEKARYSLHPACFAEQSSSGSNNYAGSRAWYTASELTITRPPTSSTEQNAGTQSAPFLPNPGTHGIYFDFQANSDISLGHLNTCHINDTPALLHQLDTCTYQVDDTDLLIFPGQSVHCEQHLTLDDEIHQELPPGGWARITAFIQAYVLAGSLTLPELQPQTWETALNRFGDEGQMDSTPRTSRLCLTPSRTRSSITSRALKQVLHGQNNSFKVSLALEVLEPLLDFPSFGFLPTRKTRQLWLPLQGLIELSAQRNQPLLGHVADICKAFNCLPRRHVQAIALHVGLPSSLVDAWHRFNGTFGNPSWSFQLATDHNKTYAWALQARDRQFLQQLRLDVVGTAEDLGGLMTYGRQRRTASHDDLLRRVQPCWSQLQRANSPTRCKQLVIYQALWPRIFHSASISDLGTAHIKQLRTKAVRALGHGRAGAAPAIRLGLLSQRTLLDPGFYQLWTILQDFKRVLSKTASMLTHWQQYMAAYDGTLGAGPFSTILRQLHQVDWKVADPPIIVDHDDIAHNLLHIPHQHLFRLLEDGWHQFLARSLAQRKDYADLAGVNGGLCQTSIKGLNAQNVATVNSQREGAFFTASAHKKFDNLCAGTCRHCGAEDTINHRCLSCPALETLRHEHQAAVQLWHDSPVCLRERLLPPRNPFYADLKKMIYDIPSHCENFAFLAEGPDEVHIFTDGSCTCPTSSVTPLAAWSSISAMHGRTIASAPLGGLPQSNNRAELQAVIASIQWLLHCKLRGHVWSDSSYVVRGTWRLLDDPSDHPRTNHDLWQCLRDACDLLQPGQLRIHHVASHREPEDCDDPVDAWSAYWNGQADELAKFTNQNRDFAFAGFWNQYQAAENDMATRLRLLTKLHLAVAERFRLPPELAAEEGEPDDPTTSEPGLLIDRPNVANSW
ncbi:unnamed protein product, partial [Effrenium voratum]